jgi:hypothetical protein
VDANQRMADTLMRALSEANGPGVQSQRFRAGAPLHAKEQLIHEHGLVSVLRQIHDDLDAAVAEAYGWPATLSDEELLTRLVALNAERAAEERRGQIRWRNSCAAPWRRVAKCEKPRLGASLAIHPSPSAFGIRHSSLPASARPAHSRLLPQRRSRHARAELLQGA